MSADDLKALNGLTNNNIRIGQKLKVSGSVKNSGASSSAKTAAAVKTETPKSSAQGSHTVADGETLYAIAQKYKMSADDLKALNGLEGNSIRPGQKLKVSGGPAVKAGAEGKVGDTKAGSKGNKNSGKSYTVADGDTLYSIARKNNMSVDELKKINNLTSDNVHPKQSLKVK